VSAGTSGAAGGGQCFEVSRADLGVTRIAENEARPPGEGEVLFTVERFGLSANNITYAALGETLRYWDLFEAEPGWGRIPVWGYLRVRSSRVPGIEAGRRAFGPCPMATEVTLRPARAGEATFAEGSAHRSGLASAYNVYSWADAATPGTDDVALVLRPVFWLSFTLDDYLSRQVPGTGPVIVTSASSKAALGLAHLPPGTACRSPGSPRRATTRSSPAAFSPTSRGTRRCATGSAVTQAGPPGPGCTLSATGASARPATSTRRCRPAGPAHPPTPMWSTSPAIRTDQGGSRAMRQLVFLGPGRAEWQETAEPAVDGALAAIVEPVAVATCDLDVAILRGTFRAFPGPFPLGHEGVARVTDIGEAVTSVSPGDLVVLPFQISCGTCRACQDGRTGNCGSVPLGSMYGYEPFGGPWGGFLADKVRVPYADAMLVPLGPAADPAAVASLSDNVPDAWRTVGPPLARAPGSEVLIVGGAGGSVPMYAIQLALALGAPAVRYLDEDPASLALAEALGAQVSEGPIPRKLGSFAVTVDASMHAEGLGCALRSTGPDGVCTSIGIYLQDTPVPLFDMYLNGVSFRTGRGHARPVIPSLLELVAAGRFRPELVTSQIADWETAPEALSEPPRKLVLIRNSA
jgi:threonine dehydrogenase-like Zn-dependent dehydrogenase